MRKYYSLIIIIIINCACNNLTDKEKESKAQSLFIKEYLSISEKSQDYRYDTSIFKLNDIVSKNEYMRNPLGLIYILNAECSFCIGKYFDFLLAVENINEQFNIYTIVDSANKETLDYYLKQSKIKLNNNITFLENIENKYVNDYLDIQNATIFYLEKNKVVGSFSFLSISANDSNSTIPK